MAGLDILTRIIPEKYNIILAAFATLLMMAGAVMWVRGLKA
jgi:hypothetical protein